MHIVFRSLGAAAVAAAACAGLGGPAAAEETPPGVAILPVHNGEADSVLEIDRSLNLTFGSGTTGSDVVTGPDTE